MIRSFVFAVILIQSLIARSESQDYSLIRDLSNDWLIIKGEKFHTYTRNTQQRSIYLFLKRAECQAESKLELVVPSGHTFFIENQLIYDSAVPSRVLIDIDSLFQHYSKDVLLLTTLAEPIIFTKLHTRLIKEVFSKKINSREYLNLSRRPNNSGSSNILITLLLVVMTIVVGYRAFQKRAFSEYFALSEVVSLRQRFEVITSATPYSLSNLSFAFLYALLIGAGVWVFSFSDGLDFFYYEIGWSIPLPRVAGFRFMLFSFFLMLLKFPLVKAISGLFHATQTSLLQYYSYLRLSIWMAIIVFIVIAVDASTNYNITTNYSGVFQNGLVLAISIRAVYIFLILNKELSFYKIHLFIYLCATEFIPQIILLKFLIK